MTFLTLTFTPTVKNPIKMLEMMQKQGNTDHFHDETGISVLPESCFLNVI